jgi:competence protein ComEC
MVKTVDASVEGSGAKPSVLTRYPNAFLIVPALSLLLGQALVPLRVPGLPFAVALFAFVALGSLLVAKAWNWVLIALLSAGALGVGYLAHEKALNPELPAHHLRSLTDFRGALYVEAVHYREPERLPDRSRWYLRTERIWLPKGARESEGRVLVTVGTEKNEWHYGDQVRLWLRVRPPHNLGNPGAFDYQSYLARRRIYLTAYLQTDAGIELLRRNPGGLWWRVESLRRQIGRFFDSRLLPEDAALLKALVVGDAGGITRELRERSVAAGVAHVLSISGLHVGMLGVVVLFLVRVAGSVSPTLMLRWNLLKLATCFSFLAVVFYTCVAGAMVPTVRSAIMIGVYEFAVLFDREEEVFSSLSLAALIIGLVWPGVVMEISFQLSFLAVLFIVWGMRKAHQGAPAQRDAEHPKEKSRLRPRMRRFALFMGVPVLATLGTGPMIAHHFGHLSLAGFVSNPVIVPLIGFAVVPLSLFSGFLSLVLPGFAGWLLIVVEPLVRLHNLLVAFFSSLPLASISVPIPSLVEVLWLYVLFLAAMLVQNRAQLALALGVSALCVLGGLSYWWQERWNRSVLRVTHLSVGHGDAAVVEFPGSKVLILDAGGSPSGEFDPGESIVAPYLRARKILKVDYLMVAHPRVDHYGGMKSIVEKFAPTEFWSGAVSGHSPRYRELEGALVSRNIKRRVVDRDDVCQNIGGVDFCVIYAARQSPEPGSLVVRLQYGAASFLLTGDIDGRDEKLMITQGKRLDSVVVKVPRHGSAGSSSPEFIAMLQPRIAVFSVAALNPFGLPRTDVIARYRESGTAILRTDEDGAVSFETDGKQLSYKTYRSGKSGTLYLGAPKGDALIEDREKS